MVKLFILKTETVFKLTCVDVHDMHYLIKNISIMFDKTHIVSYINNTLTTQQKPIYIYVYILV